MRTTLLLLPLAACIGTRTPDTRPAFGRNALVEQARDGEHTLARGQVNFVDPRSDLVLRFEPPVTAEPARANAAYTTAKQLASEQSAIVARFAKLPPGESAELTAAQQTCAEYSQRVVAFFGEVMSLGVTQEELMRDAPDFTSLITLLERRVADLQRTVERRRNDSEWQVTVRARLDRAGSEPRYLHVPWYDTLSEGDMKPRYGGFLGLDRQEAETLAAELRASEAAAKALREIRAELAHGGDLLRTMRDDLQKAAAALLTRIEAQPRQALDNLQADLNTLAGKDATRVDATKALAIVAEWRATLTALGGRVADLRQLVATLQRPGTTTLSALFEANGAVAKALAGLPELAAKLAAWPEQAATLAPLLADLARREPGLLLPSELVAFFGNVGNEAPALTAALVQLANLSKLDPPVRDSAIAAAAPPPTTTQTLFMPLDGAPEARIRLGATNVAEGERVRIEAIAYPKGQAPGQTPGLGDGRLVESWEADVERYGFYPHIGGKLIFARADRGTAAAKDWKPNVAAVADMHLRLRDPNWLGGVWNTLDPGLGVHLASLDQGDEDIEFGFGVNLSLFGGFITGGYGQNLTLDEHRDYWFFGVDLLQVLSEAQGLARR